MGVPFLSLGEVFFYELVEVLVYVTDLDHSFLSMIIIQRFSPHNVLHLLCSFPVLKKMFHILCSFGWDPLTSQLDILSRKAFLWVLWFNSYIFQFHLHFTLSPLLCFCVLIDYCCQVLDCLHHFLIFMNVSLGITQLSKLFSLDFTEQFLWNLFKLLGFINDYSFKCCVLEFI